MKRLLLSCLCLCPAFNLPAAENFDGTPAPYIVYLKSGTVLTRLSDRSNFAIGQGAYVKVLETNYKKRDLFLVYDENGIAKYETTAAGIVEVQEDLNILPVQAADVVYPTPSRFKLADKTIDLDTSFNVHMDNLHTEDFNVIYSDNLSSVTASRFEWRTLYNHNAFPVRMGGNVNFQSTSWRNDFDQVRLSILSFGPVFQYAFYQEEDLNVSAVLGAEFAPIYKTSSGNSNEEFKAMLFDIGVEATWSTQYGLWSFGSHFRKHDIALKKTSRPGVDPVVRQMNINSLGLMAGYKYEWDL